MSAVKPKESISSPQRRYDTGNGKYSFPQIIDSCTTLPDLVCQDSWIIFSLLNTNHSFLVKDVLSWPCSAAYQKDLVKRDAINAINDCAERDVHLDQISLPQREPSDTIRMLAGVGIKQTTSKFASTKRKKIDKILLLQVLWHRKIL